MRCSPAKAGLHLVRGLGGARILPTGLALLAACGGQAEVQPDAQPGPSVSVVGDTAFLELPVGRSADNGEITVTFEGVSEDSRCPRGVQCVWEGNGAIRLTLTGGDETQLVILNSALNPRQTSFGPYLIGFRDLTPYRVSGEPFDTREYAAHIAIIDTR
jgi:hypothetical protein